MEKGPIFLSAGVPFDDDNRNPGGKTYKCDAVAIRDAIRALIAVVVPHRSLVFGGQKGITKYVWDAAHSLKAEEFVVIYQSELFRSQIPPQATYFRNLVWTPAIPNADPSNPQHRQICLETMRRQMIEQRTLGAMGGQLPPYDAAVFIGGMDGIEAEWKMFTKAYPHTPVLPVGSTAGAAKNLLDQQFSQVATKISWTTAPIPGQLDGELQYRDLFRSLLN